MAAVLIIAAHGREPVAEQIAGEFHRSGVEVAFPPPGEPDTPEWLSAMERRIAAASAGVIVAGAGELMRERGLAYQLGLLRGFGSRILLVLPLQDRRYRIERRFDRCEVTYADFASRSGQVFDVLPQQGPRQRLRRVG